MFGAPPPGFMQNLDRKYALMGRDVAARELAAQSGANLNMARAAGIGADADFQRARTEAVREGLADNRALFGDRLADLNAQTGTRVAQTGLYGAQTGFTEQQAGEIADIRRFGDTLARSRNLPPTTSGLPAVSAPTVPSLEVGMPRWGLSREAVTGPDQRDRFRFAKGTARVPGKGSGKVDTVPAKLAPGEAVLNRAAADMTGRGLIAALNKLGAQKMGLV